MIFYFILCTLVFCLSYAQSKSKDKYISLDIKVMLFLLMFLPAAFRVGIGTDYNTYVKIFNNLARGHESKTELGWIVVNQIVYKNGLGVQWIFAISSFLTLIWLFLLDKDYFYMSIFVWFLYYYTNSFNAVRNAISISMFYYSYYLCVNDKRIKGFILIILGSLFHNSALIYIPVYLFMCYIPISKKSTLIIAVLGYVMLRLFHLSQMIMDSSLITSTKYGAYVTLLKYNSTTQTSSGLGILLRHFVLFLTYFLCSESKTSKKNFSAMSFLFLAVLFSDILMTQIYIFSRLRTIFLVGYMAMYVHLFSWKSRNIWIELFKLFSLSHTLIFYFLYSIIENMNEVVPYASIFGVF